MQGGADSEHYLQVKLKLRMTMRTLPRDPAKLYERHDRRVPSVEKCSFPPCCPQGIHTHLRKHSGPSPLNIS